MGSGVVASATHGFQRETLRRRPVIVLAVSAILAAMPISFLLSGCATTAGTESLPTESNVDVGALLKEAEEALLLGEYAASLEILSRIDAGGGQVEAADHARHLIESMAVRLRLEPGSEWLDSQARQVSFPLQSLVGSGEPLPSVLLTISEGPARVAMAGATIRFEVISGAAEIITLAQTTDFGQATVSLLRARLTDEGLIVRASMVVPVGGDLVDLGVEPIEFVYNPPATLISVITGVIRDGAALDAPDLARAVTGRLGDYGSLSTDQASSYDSFVDLWGGNPEFISVALRNVDAGFLAVVVAEVFSVKQVELQGKLYDIWRSTGIASLSIFDPSGGLAIATIQSEEVDGQGATADEAVADLVDRAGDALLVALEARHQSLASILGPE